MLNALPMPWPSKARALSGIATAGAASPRIRRWAAGLGLAQLAAPHAAGSIASAVGRRVQYRRESGDWFAGVDAVLERGADDCDGHAVVAASLAAAAGHPARIVGVSLPHQHEPHHVRAEVGDGRAWFSADSTPAAAVRPLRLYSPTAPVGRGQPAPVAGLLDDIGDALSDAVDTVGDGLSTLVEETFGYIAAGGRYLTSRAVLDDMRAMISDPDVWLTLGLIAGCATVTGPLAMLAASTCASVAPSAAVVLAGMTVDRIGPSRWRELDAAERAARLRRARTGAGVEEFAARTLAAQELLRMAPSTPGARMAQDPQIARSMIAALRAHPNGDTRSATNSVAMFLRTDRDYINAALRLLAWPRSDIRARVQQAYTTAARASDARIEATLANCPNPRPDVLTRVLRPQFGDAWRLHWCAADQAQRQTWARQAVLTREGCPAIRPYVRNYMRDTMGLGHRYAMAWCSASPELRAEYKARADIHRGACLPIPPDVRNWLQARTGGMWATHWCGLDAAGRDAARSAARSQRAAVNALADGLRINDPRPSAEDLNNARLADPNAARRPRRSGGGGGGAAALGLAALLGLALRAVGGK